MIRKKIVIYLRKSRSDAEYETVEEVLSRHEKQLQEYALRTFGAKIDEENIYREVISGETIEDRPMMKKLLRDIEKGEIEGLVVIEPQRLTRGSFTDIDIIVNTLKYTNTKVYTPPKIYDLNNKYDRKMFEQELLRGTEYLEYTKEILARGRIRSVEDGYYIASVLPYGYDKVKVGKKGYKLIPNKDADNVRYIFKKFIDGLGTTNLAKHLIEIGIESQTGKKWTPAMTRNILTNDIYIGILTYGKRAVKKSMVNGSITQSRPLNNEYLKSKGLHEPLIDEDTFNKAQDILKSTKGKNISGNKELKNPLAGIIKCKFCGNNMFRRSYDKRAIPTLICKTIGCNNISSDLNLVEERVLSLLEKELSNYKYYVDNYEEEHKNNTSDINKRIDKIDKELIDLQNDLQNALINYNRSKITIEEYNFLKDYTTKEKYRLNGLKIALNEELENDELDNKKKAIPIIENCLKEYHTLSIKDKHMFLTSIIDKIIYEKTENGRWNEEARSSFKLELFLKI